MSEKTDRIIYRAELADYLGIPKERAGEWVRRGRLPKPDIDITQQTRGWLVSTLRRAGFLPGVQQLPPRVLAYTPLPPAFNVYRHYDRDGVLLYVGMSKSALGRFVQHFKTAPWVWSVARVEIERHPTRDAALAAERRAIKAESPLFNVRQKERA